MRTILKIDASVRSLDNDVPGYRSLSRQLSQHFQDQWTQRNREDLFIHRDVGATPPDFISQEWIGAVFTPEQQRNPQQQALTRLSDQLIEEIAQADLILISTPMYNYGMPASLKAWFDQVVRVNKTFSFDLARGDFPLQPLFSGKTLVLLSSCGEFGFEAGGIRASMDHLGPHVRTLSRYLGVEEFHEIRIEYQEFNDDRHQQSIKRAYRAVGQLVEKLNQQSSSAA